MVGKSSERGPVCAEFLKLGGDFSAWFLTFPDRRGGGWEMLAQELSGPEVGWRCWAAAPPGAPGRDIGPRLAARTVDTCVTEHVPWRWGLSRPHADVVRVGRFSVRQEPGSAVEQALARHGASSVFGAGSRCRPFVHPSRGGPSGPHTEQNWKQFSPRAGTHRPLHRVSRGK